MPRRRNTTQDTCYISWTQHGFQGAMGGGSLWLEIVLHHSHVQWLCSMIWSIERSPPSNTSTYKTATTQRINVRKCMQSYRTPRNVHHASRLLMCQISWSQHNCYKAMSATTQLGFLTNTHIKFDKFTTSHPSKYLLLLWQAMQPWHALLS